MNPSSSQMVLPAAGERFLLLPTTRHVLPIAVVLGVIMAIFAPGMGVRLGFVLVSLVLLCLAIHFSRHRPHLVVTPEGYRVEVDGKKRFTVSWQEVNRVLCDRGERALYVDCGEARRNLLLPPERGYAFTFSRRQRLYEVILAIVPDRVHQVTNLEDVAK